ncbi:4'-phosphopantetheinyl transferase superfamily protein [Streptacidiphilus sp. PB12-B1b]|nr:4'-phosphopantetheinyl transferase superfamily protein [Streptacidiphilus sp. PB12-B1b]
MHLWLRETAGVPEEPALLDADERVRAARFVRDADRHRYVASHVLLRRILSRYTGTPPEQLGFTREDCPCCGEPHGRPALAGQARAPHFSLSHAGALVLVAVAAEPVGADVEEWPAADSVAGLAGVLHPAEQAELAAAGHGREAFTRLWTRKEAYLKGLGTGLGRAMELDYVGDRQPGPDGWTLADAPARPGYAAAVALRADTLAIVPR